MGDIGERNFQHAEWFHKRSEKVDFYGDGGFDRVR